MRRLSGIERLERELGIVSPPVKTQVRVKRANGSKQPGAYTLANEVDTTRVLDWLGISYETTPRGHMTTCPGCGEAGALVAQNGGVKCLHDRCSHAGPADYPGFRSNIDIVAQVQSIDPIDAALAICEQFGIEVPKFDKADRDDYVHTDDDAPDAPPKSEEKPEGESTRKPLTPGDIIGQWAVEGPLVRVPTGIEPLDDLCRGGIPCPWLVVAVGAPGAGKTFFEGVLADKLAREAEAAGMVVGILAIDEDPEDVTVRLAQMAGFTVAAAEMRHADTLVEMSKALSGLRLRMYDATWTIEAASDDLAAWAKEEGRSAALFVDSVQTARADLAAGAQTPREQVEGAIRALKLASTNHRMLVFATSEANRSSYRNQDAADTTNDLAAGAESRVIEFAAQTLLVLRTPKGHDDVVHVRVAKNRRAHRGEFWLRLDRDRHTVAPCPDPSGTPEAQSDVEARKQAANRKKVLLDAERLAGFLVRHPAGMGVRDLRNALKLEGWGWGQGRLDAAKLELKRGHKGVRLVEIDHGAGKQKELRLERDPIGGGEDELD